MRANPPRSRTGWPALGWMAGQTGNGQLFTTVRVSVAWDRGRSRREMKVMKENEAMVVLVLVVVWMEIDTKGVYI